MRLLTATFFAAIAATPVLAQTDRVDLLDIFKAKVKPERATNYEAAVKKLVQMNRKNGDRWIVFTTQYGDERAYYFSSLRHSMAEAEAGETVFLKAVTSVIGEAGFAKMDAEMGTMVNSAGAEIRRRRWDLSVRPPSSAEEMLKAAARSRYFRLLTIGVRPGRMQEWIEAWKPWQVELNKMPNTSVWVSQSVTGAPAVYIAVYYKDFAGMDADDSALAPLVRTEIYATYLKATAPLVTSSKWEIHRIRPDLSNPPAEVIAADPEFWTPKKVTAPVKKIQEKK